MSIFTRLERTSQRTDRYRWVALAITTSCQAAVSSLSWGIGPLAPFLQASFNASLADIGVIRTTSSLSSIMVALAGGRAADRVGERRVLIVSAVVAGLVALALALANSYWALLAGCFVIGLGFGIQNPAGSAAIMRWFPPRQRAFAMGIRQTGVPVGGIIAATVWPVLALAYGWRSAFLVGGLLTLAGAALIFVGYYDPAQPKNVTPRGPLPLRQLLRERQIRWIALIFNSQIIAQYAVMTYFVLFLHDALEFSVVMASSLLALGNLLAIVARIAWGMLSDRQFDGRRRPVLLIILVLTLVSTLSAAALPRGTAWPLAAVVALLFGVSAFAWTGILGTMTVESVGRETAGTAVALVTTLGSPGLLVSPPLFGYIADHAGYRAAWLAVAGVVALSLVAFFNLSESVHEPPQPV